MIGCKNNHIKQLKWVPGKIFYPPPLEHILLNFSDETRECFLTKNFPPVFALLFTVNPSSIHDPISIVLEQETDIKTLI